MLGVGVPFRLSFLGISEKGLRGWRGGEERKGRRGGMEGEW